MKKSLLCIFLIMAFCIPFYSEKVLTEDTIMYLENGETKYCDYYVPVNSETDKWTDGWYVVSDKITVGDGTNRGILVTGDAKLILTDLCLLTVNGGIQVEQGSKLTVYAQSDNFRTQGELDAYGMKNHAGIGGGAFGDCGEIVIYGGTIKAYGGEDSAGIGGGFGGDGGKVTVYGGRITAESGEDMAAGIGSGGPLSVLGNSAGSLTIYNGSVYAEGGYRAAGVGGCFYGDGGDVTIHNGKLTAKGGYGAGIGGGQNCDGGSFTIFDGNVVAYSEYGGAGIGGGYNGDGGSFSFFGGTITAYVTSVNTDLSEKDKHAVGAGAYGGDYGTIEYGYGLIFIDSKTGKPFENSFSLDLRGYLRGSHVNISAVTSADFPVTYQNHQADGTAYNTDCSDYIYLYNSVATWSNGFYVMEGNGTFQNNIAVTGNVSLILMNNSDLTINGSIIINDGCSLTIYVQPGNENTVGKLTVNGGSRFAAIGGQGPVTIHGGTISAKGASYCAGIGGMYNGHENRINVTVYDGDITAIGGAGAAGIGGCYESAGCNLKIYGGKFTASGGTYFNKTCRGIGAGMTEEFDHGTITTADGIGLFETATGKQYDRGFSQKPWTEIISDTSVSFYAASVSEPTPVKYLYCNTNKQFETGSCSKYTTLNKLSNTLKDGWYVLDESGTIDNIVFVTGDVHLILMDECELNVIGGIRVNEGSKLTIYAQSEGSNMGVLTADCSNIQFGSGIGSSSGLNCGEVTIHGGKITGIGGEYGAGIGGGSHDIHTGIGSSGGTVTIYGGDVTAFGGGYAAGIGGGYLGNGADVFIYGGHVTALGGCEGASGIGKGINGQSGGRLIVSGGIIDSYGGSAVDAITADTVIISPMKKSVINVRTENDVLLNGSPFEEETDITELLEKHYEVHIEGPSDGLLPIIPDGPDIPVTGDRSNILHMFILSLISGTLLLRMTSLLFWKKCS